MPFLQQKFNTSSQLPFVIAPRYKYKNANILYNSIIKTKPTTKSVLAARLYAATHALNYAATSKKTLHDIFDKNVHIASFANSKSLTKVIFGINTTSKKRILIDLCLLTSHLSYAS